MATVKAVIMIMKTTLFQKNTNTELIQTELRMLLKTLELNHNKFAMLEQHLQDPSMHTISVCMHQHMTFVFVGKLKGLCIYHFLNH